MSIQKDLTACRIVEAGDKTDQRALARARGSHQSYGLAGLDTERNVMQHWRPGKISKIYRPEFDAACTRSRDSRIGCFSNLRLRREHIPNPFCRNRRFPHHAGHFSDLADWSRQASQVGEEDEKISRRNLSGKNLNGAVPDYNSCGQGHHQTYQRGELRLQLAGLQGCIERQSGLFGEAIVFVSLAAVGLHQVNIGNDLLNLAPKLAFFPSGQAQGLR
jgi:hypothetical protein